MRATNICDGIVVYRFVLAVFQSMETEDVLHFTYLNNEVATITRLKIKCIYILLHLIIAIFKLCTMADVCVARISGNF